MNHRKSVIYLKLAALLSCLVLLSVRCEQPDDEPIATEKRDTDGAVVSKDYLWQQDITEKGLVWVVLTPALYQNTVVVAGATAQEQDMLVALDVDSGKEVWRWTDFLSQDRGATMNDSEYGINQKDNIWLLQDGYHYYAIDLATGSTLWKQRLTGQGGIGGIQIVGDQYYTSFSFYQDSVLVPTVVQGDVYSTAFQKVVEPPVDTIQLFSDFYGTMEEPYVYEEDGQRHAFLQFDSNVDVYQGKNFNFVASYNLTSGRYNFEKTQLGDTMQLPFSSRAAMYQDVMIVNPDGELFGVNKHTGEVVWHRNEYDKNGDGVSTYAIYQDRLFVVNNTGFTSRVMALDPLTGQTIWEDIGRGNAAHALHFLNGVLYFGSRGDGKLYAYNTDTGELLWRIQSPEWETFQGYGGTRVVPGTDGKKGKVIACTWATAYCYEAIR